MTISNYHETLTEVEPLREVPEQMKIQDDIYKTLRETFGKKDD